MIKLKAILIDDEKIARDLLAHLITNFCPQIEIVDICHNIMTAVSSIKEYKPDVVFSDIEMPNYAGYELVNFFKKVTFDIIFISSHDQYAIKAFQISAVDYLLKPIEIHRLQNAVAKVLNKREYNNSYVNYKNLSENLQLKNTDKIIIRHNGNQKILLLDHIITIEAREAYSCIHTIKGQFLVSKNLKYYEKLFERKILFYRTHKSWIINRNHLITYSKTSLEIKLNNRLIAKLSKYRKHDFEQFLLQS